MFTRGTVIPKPVQQQPPSSFGGTIWDIQIPRVGMIFPSIDLQPTWLGLWVWKPGITQHLHFFWKQNDTLWVLGVPNFQTNPRYGKVTDTCNWGTGIYLMRLMLSPQLISGIGGLGENMKVEDETMSPPGWVLGWSRSLICIYTQKPGWTLLMECQLYTHIKSYWYTY